MSQVELPPAHNLKSTYSTSSTTGITSESLAQPLAQLEYQLAQPAQPLVSLEKQPTISKISVTAAVELVELPVLAVEQSVELDKTTAPQGLSQLSYLNSPAALLAFMEGDSVDLETSDGIWDNDWVIAVADTTSIGNRYRIERNGDALSVSENELRPSAA